MQVVHPILPSPSLFLCKTYTIMPDCPSSFWLVFNSISSMKRNWSVPFIMKLVLPQIILLSFVILLSLPSTISFSKALLQKTSKVLYITHCMSHSILVSAACASCASNMMFEKITAVRCVIFDSKASLSQFFFTIYIG